MSAARGQEPASRGGAMQDRGVREELDRLFMPRNVALIGATNNLSKWGGMILANIITNKFKGKVYPINLRDRRVLGLEAYPSILDVPETVDLACIVTPAATVPQILAECGRKGVRTVLVISSDFSETGAEGRRREELLKKEAARFAVRLIGPNSMGIFSAPRSLVCMMALMEPRKGDISFVSQSGNIGVHMMVWGKSLSAGFRYFVSSGNEAHTSCTDYIEYFGDDPHCRVIMAYLESLKGGGPGFVERARKVAEKKPVLVFKGGKTQAGQRAAVSHTGALAGVSGVFDAAFRQAGLIQVRTTEAFIDCARILGRLPVPRGNRVGIITRGGGWGVITADACEEQGLRVASLDARTLEALDRLLPAYWSRGNPVDLVAVPDIGVYLRCAQILAQDRNVDGIIALGSLPERIVTFLRKPALKKATGMDDSAIQETESLVLKAAEEVVEGLIELMGETGKPVVMVGGRRLTPRIRALMEKAGVHFYPTPERAVRVMARLMEYGMFRRRCEEGYGRREGGGAAEGFPEGVTF